MSRWLFHGLLSCLAEPFLYLYTVPCRNNDEDTETMLNNLRTHKYQALILDSPVVQYFAAKVSLRSSHLLECSTYCIISMCCMHHVLSVPLSSRGLCG
jgi:hypothetical protein